MSAHGSRAAVPGQENVSNGVKMRVCMEPGSPEASLLLVLVSKWVKVERLLEVRWWTWT